jgi:iron complex outermembrane receptor protein
MYYRNQLVSTGRLNDVGAYTRTNVPESYRAGVELSATIQPVAWLSVSANGTFSANRIQKFDEYIDNYDAPIQQVKSYRNTTIALSPSIVTSGIATIKPSAKLGLEADLLFRHIGKQYLDNTTNEARSLPAYSLADLRLRYSMNHRKIRNLSLMLSVNNLTNAKYVSNGYTFSYVAGGSTNTFNYYYPQAGTNGMFTAMLGF